jgi:hypothetical protein
MSQGGSVMKHAVLAAVIIMFIAVGVSFAAAGQDKEKDWCLLGISNKCSGSTSIDLVDKIRRLDIAIKKGTAVYTPEELDHLKKMLDDAHETEELLFRRY